MRRLLAVLGLVVVMVGLAGCATMPGAGGGASTSSGTPSVTPTAACPIQPGVELPPECAGYDPEQAMALNDRYRERMPYPGDDPEAAAVVVDETRAALELLRASGEWDEDAVRSTLEARGLDDARTLPGRDVRFGASAPGGGCVFGLVAADAVTVELGGYILDGGCLPAQ